MAKKKPTKAEKIAAETATMRPRPTADEHRARAAAEQEAEIAALKTQIAFLEEQVAFYQRKSRGR